MAEAETASFVLAYLLRSNYSQTATAFLQECRELPSKTFLILPETPLQSIIASHKSRSDTSVLVNTLGRANAWGALWDKLEQTLQQLRMLHEETGVGQTTKQGNSSMLSQHSRATRSRKKVSPPTTHTHTAQPPAHAPPHSHPPHASTVSPHRRKPVPKRKEVPGSPSRAVQGPPSPSVQHVLDSLLEDNELPGKLADIINRCVSPREDSDLSPLTLDQIIGQTYSDPALEGLLSHVTTSGDHVTAPHVSCPEETASPEVVQSPPVKKSKMESTLTEKDIDDFLDQLHS